MNIHSKEILYVSNDKYADAKFFAFKIDTTKYNANYAAGYSGIVNGTYTSLANETITIDWGDGSTTSVSDGVFSAATNTHTYANPGTYIITINSTGGYPKFNFETSFTSTYRKILTEVLTPFPVCYNTNGTVVTEYSRVFCGCSSLTAINKNLFKNNPDITSFWICFSSCTALTEIPKDLFKYNTAATNFQSCFEICSAITEVPKDLFRTNTAATNFQSCFSGCSNLVNVPSDIFKYNTNASNFYACFMSDRKLQTPVINIVRDSFYDVGRTNLTLDEFFYGCNLITTQITEEYIDMYYSVVGSLRYLCSGWLLSSIPEHIFDKYTENTSFLRVFANCTLITSIPEDIFRYNTKVTDFGSCFFGTRISSVPENLFRYNIEGKDFSNMFYNCSNLTTVPQNLFRYNTEATTFASLFGNGGFTTIPVDLFRYNTKVTNFGSTFYNCRNLTTVPADIFRYNTLATYFRSTFQSCTNLTTIPENLFTYNVRGYNFESCFESCNKLQLISNLFGTDYANRFSYASFSGGRMFYRTSFTGTQGTAPPMWNYTYRYGQSHSKTFGGAGNSATSLSNYASIPSNWIN